MEFTNKQQVFAQIYSGTFATPKKLNRSSKLIPAHYLESIESGIITSKMLEELNTIVPIYVYKTCITVHGALPQINISRIGGYANVIQNANGSVEFRYSAIDYKIKKELAKLLKEVYTIRENSTHGIYFEICKSFRNKEEAISYINTERERINTTTLQGIKARLTVSGYYYFGTYYVFTTLIPLLIEGDAINIASQLTGKSTLELIELQESIKQEAINKEIEYQNTLERIRLQKEAINKIEAEALTTLKAAFKPAKITKEGYYITYALNGLNYKYKLIKVTKGTFGRFKHEYTTSSDLNNFDLTAMKAGIKQLKGADISYRPVFEYSL